MNKNYLLFSIVMLISIGVVSAEVLFIDGGESGGYICDNVGWNNNTFDCVRSNVTYSSDVSYSGNYSIKTPDDINTSEGGGWIYLDFTSYLDFNVNSMYSISYYFYVDRVNKLNPVNGLFTLESGFDKPLEVLSIQPNLMYYSGGLLDTGLVLSDGWHKYELIFNVTSASVYVDDVLIFNDLVYQGYGYYFFTDFGRPTDSTWYLDDIKLETVSPIPESVVVSRGLGVGGGSVPIVVSQSVLPTVSPTPVEPSFLAKSWNSFVSWLGRLF